MRKFLMLLAFAAPIGLTLGLAPAVADDDERIAVATDPLTQKECSACHIAFPPSMLPAASWSKIMADLSNHFGDDASLPPADAKAIEAYLTANAGPDRLAADPAAPPLRITELPWFKREHSEEVSPRQMQKAGSMANCAACHRGAANGVFEDD